jgi:hypothetical protein
MTYTQVWDPMTNAPSQTVIVRDEDGAFIPFDPDNIDYQAYLAWLDEGNQPTPYTGPTPPLAMTAQGGQASPPAAAPAPKGGLSGI